MPFPFDTLEFVCILLMLARIVQVLRKPVDCPEPIDYETED